MKRKLKILGLCVVAGVGVVFLLSNGKTVKRNSGTSQGLVVTQDGKLTLVAQPAGYDTPVIIANQPKAATNTPTTATNSPNK